MREHTPPLADRVDPARTALLVIDMQNDFVHPDGANGKYDCLHPVRERSRP